MDVDLSPDQDAALQRFLMENSVVELRSVCSLTLCLMPTPICQALVRSCLVELRHATFCAHPHSPRSPCARATSFSFRISPDDAVYKFDSDAERKARDDAPWEKE